MSIISKCDHIVIIDHQLINDWIIKDEERGGFDEKKKKKNKKKKKRIRGKKNLTVFFLCVWVFLVCFLIKMKKEG